MKKVGTLTYHRSHNYGSVLQAYALEKVINSIDNTSCEIIDYYPPNYELLYSVFVKNNSVRNVARNLYVLLKQYRQKKNRFNNFVKFQDRYNVSEKSFIENIELLKDIDGKYDTIVCGSDQIWCVDAPDFSMAYLMPNLQNVKKVAYAPSMGYGNFLGYSKEKEIKAALEKFDAVSVREKDGAEKIKALMGGDYNVQVVLDPTFLLPIEEYDKICEDRLIKEDYIFFYSVGFREQNATIMEWVAKKTGLPVYTLATNTSSNKYKGYGIKFVENSTPEAFLSLIKNAKIVFSSSFHGNVFSVIFRKNFYSLYTVKDGLREDDPRLNTLFESLNLPNRAVDINNFDKIDYNQIFEYDDEKINSEIKRSKEFLLNSI